MPNKQIRALRDKSDRELDAELRSCREALYRMRTDNAMGRLEDKNGMKKRRKEIARILTLQRERELAGERK